MGELYNPFPKLPKNIRQIGERDDVVKLYVEDYVNTYLKRLYPVGGQDLRVGLLLGTTETKEGVPYIFIDGALEMEDVTAAGEKVVFTEAAWKKAYQRIEETFPKRTVQGWFICGAPGCILSPLNYWRQHNQYFGGKNQLMYINSGIDGEEALYVTSEDGFYRLKGHQIYYERNQMMQDYMILRKDVRRVETGTGDRVIRDFRSRMEGRKQEAVSRHGTIRTLGTLCGVLSVAVLAGGIVMVNNYQKMKEMESVLVSVLPEGVRGVAGDRIPEAGDSMIVEEIRGEVMPLPPGETGAVMSGDSDIKAEGDAADVLVNGETISKQSLPGETSALDEPALETSAREPYILPEPEAQRDLSPGGKSGGEVSGSNVADGGTGTGGSSGTSGGTGTDSSGGTTGSAAGTGAGGNSTAIQDYPVTNMKPGSSYIIGEGETLYGICFKLYSNLNYLDDIRALNHLTDADHIIAGQELILPELP